MRANTALVIEPAASWRRLQESSEFFFEDLDAQMKEHHREFLEALMGYERQGTLAAIDFLQLSTTLSPYTPYSETQPFMTSADILGPNIPGTQTPYHNWLGGNVPDGGMTIMLLGMGVLGIGSMRRFLKK